MLEENEDFLKKYIFIGDSVVDNDLETILPITIKSFLYLLIIEPVLKRIKSYLNY